MDDVETIKQIQAGDTESFEILVTKYHKHLLNFIYRLVGNKNIVEDLGQEILLSVYRSIRTFNVQRGVPFSAWLFITARNRCISEMRKKTREKVSIDDISCLTSREKTPEQAVSCEEQLLAIHAALAQLPEPYRRTILQSLQGDSPEEIALNCRISRGTVKSRLSRARERLRLLLNIHSGGD